MFGALVAMAGVSALAGCSGPDTAEVEPILQRHVLAVPGITGSVRFSYAEFDPLVSCDLTSTAADPVELDSAFDDVLRAIADVIRPYEHGTVRVSVTNGTDTVAEGTPYGSLSFEDLRQRYPLATPVIRELSAPAGSVAAQSQPASNAVRDSVSPASLTRTSLGFNSVRAPASTTTDIPATVPAVCPVSMLTR